MSGVVRAVYRGEQQHRTVDESGSGNERTAEVEVGPAARSRR